MGSFLFSYILNIQDYVQLIDIYFYGLDYHDSFWILTNEILNKHFDNFAKEKNVIIIDPTNKMLKDKINMKISKPDKLFFLKVERHELGLLVFKQII